MQVYTGTCGSLAPLGPCNTANGPAGSMSLTFAVTSGTLYYIMVDGQSGNQESFDITATSISNSIVARPDANFIVNPTNGCAPLSVFLDNTSSLFGGTNISYQWRIDGGAYRSSSGADTTINFTTVGNHQIELRVCNDECGCKSVIQDVVVQNLVPTISFTPANSCLNNPISFTGNATVQPSPPVINPNVTSWLWNFGDPNSGVNNTASGQNVIHTFVGPGTTFTVRLIADGYCGPDTVTTTVTLNARTRVNAGPAITLCQGSPVTLAATTTNTTAPVSFTWSGNPTIVCPSCSSTAVTGLAPGGPYTYTIHTVDANGCVADTTVNVTIRVKPVVNAGVDDTVCMNTPTVLNGSVSAGIPPLTYTWSPAAGLSSTSILNPTATTSIARTYCLRATDSFGCASDSDCVSLSVYPKPTISSSPSYLCASMNPPLQTSFTVNGAGAGSTYSWKLSSAYSRISSSNGDSSVVTATFPNSAAAYSFTVIVFNPSSGCRDTIVTSFTVNAGINVTTSANRTICAGTSTTLTSRGATSYAWTANPVYSFSNPSDSNQTVSPLVTTTFIVRGFIGNCYEEDTVVVTVRPKPVVNAGSDDTVCVNTPYTLNGTLLAGIPPMTYVWTPATGLSSTSILNPTATINSTRTYCLKATDSFGCASDSDCVTLRVYPLPTVSASPSTLCASMNPPLQTTFTVSGGGAGSTYSWRRSTNYSLITSSNGDSSSVTATFPPGVASAYLFTVVVFNPSTGCRDTLNTTFTVTASLNMTSSASRTICAGTSTNITASGATTYSWSAIPAYVFSNPALATQTVSPTVTTSFIVRGTTGNCYDEDTVVVTVRPKPVVNAGPDDTVCVNTPTPLNANVIAGLPPFIYTWSPSAGLSSTSILSPTATIGATRTYCLTARDTFGCVSDSDCVTLNVYPVPTVSANPATICASQNPPLQSTFTVNGAGPGSTYSWRRSTNYSLISSSNVDSSVVTATFPPGVASTYNFTVIVFNPVTGCRDTINSSFVVTNGLNMTTTANQQLCIGDSVTLTASGATTYVWTAVPAYAFSNPAAASQRVSPGVTTTFYVTGTTGSCSDMDTVTVTIRPKPLVNAGVDDTVCAFIATPLTGSVSGGIPPFTYSWTPVTGLSGATSLTPTATVSSTTSYCLKATDTFGCKSDSDCVTLFVYPKPQVSASPSTLCASQAPPLQSTFTVTGASAGSTYSWRLSPNYSLITTSSADSSSVTAVFPTGVSATYNFSVIVQDAVTGCKDTIQSSFTVTPGINMTVSPGIQLCSGSSATLSATGTSTYSWTSVPVYAFSDATSDTQLVTLTANTTFYVTGTIGTCSDIDTINVTIIPLPVASIGALPVFCRCDTVTLNGSASTPGMNYLWTSSGGNTINNSTFVNASAVICANDTVRLTVTDPVTTCTASTSQIASPKPMPAAVASVSPSLICDGDTSNINLSGAGSNVDLGTTFLWTSNPLVAISNDTLLSTTASASTLTVFNLTVTDSSGCDTTVSATLQIYPVPLISASNPFLCTSDPVLQSTVSITGAGAGSTYVWDSIPICVTPQIAGGASQLFDFATCGTGVYRFVVTVTDGVNGCVKTLVQTVTVVNGVVLTLTPDQELCEGDSTNLIVSGANTFNWNTGDVNDTLVVGDTLSAVASPHLFIVTGTVGSCSATDSVTLIVNPRPVTPSINGSVSVCENDTSGIYSIVAVPGIGYLWSVTGGTISAGQGTDTLLVNWGSAGPGTVSLTDTNIFGCPGTPQLINITINPVPASPVISGNDTLCQNELAVYTIPAVAGVQYNWTAVNGIIQSGVNTNSITIQWVTAGTGQVIIQLTNATNCSSAPDTFYVEVKPIPVVNPITGNSALCEGDTTQLYYVTEVAGNTYQWILSGGTIVSGQSTDSIWVNWPSAGLGMLQLLETGSNGCVGDTNSLPIFINLAPIATASPDTLLICRNQAVQLTGTVNIGNPQWLTSGTGTFSDSTLLSPVYTPGATDSGYVYLYMIVSNPPCPDDTDVVVLFISPSPVASIATTAGDTLCTGSIDTLTASGGTSYDWMPTADTTASIVVSPTSTTIYTVIVGNNFGCFDSASVQIVVLPAGIPTAGGDQGICSGDSVFLNGTVQDASGIQWTTTGDGTFSPNDTSLSVTYIPGPNDTSNHSVALVITSVGACLNLTDTVVITISTVPAVFAGNDTTIASSAVLQLNGVINFATGGIWTSSGTGTFTPDDTSLNASYQPSQSDIDNDSIILYLTTTGGCRLEIDSMIVRFIYFQIPNVFTPYPNSPGYNDYFEVLGLPSGSSLKIWDRWGLLVFQSDNYRNDWDAAELNSDTYYYILTTFEKEYKGWIKVIREN